MNDLNKLHRIMIVGGAAIAAFTLLFTPVASAVYVPFAILGVIALGNDLVKWINRGAEPTDEDFR